MKAFLIYIIVSVVAFLVVITPESEAEYYGHLEERLENSNQIMKAANNSILENMSSQFADYPQYYNYINKLKIIDSITNNLIEQSTNDLVIINNDFIDLIDEDSYNHNINEQKKKMRRSLYRFNDNLMNKKEQLFFKDDLFKSAVMINERMIINHFSSSMKTNCGFSVDEPSFFNQSIITTINQPYNVQFALSNSFKKFRMKNIKINGKSITMKYDKAEFKTKANQKGWNEIHIFMEGTLFDKPMRKEKTFRYFVK